MGPGTQVADAVLILRLLSVYVTPCLNPRWLNVSLQPTLYKWPASPTAELVILTALFVTTLLFGDA